MSPDDRYRRAARTFAAWRSDGTFRKDPRPSLYVYEQVPAGRRAAVIGAEPGASSAASGSSRSAPGAACAPRERAPARPSATIATSCSGRPASTRARSSAASRSDRRRRAGVLAATAADRSARRLERRQRRSPPAVGVAAEGPDAERGMTLIAAIAGAGPSRSPTARRATSRRLRYRDERRMSRSCEEDPAFDYILTLFVERADDAASPPRPPTGLSSIPTSGEDDDRHPRPASGRWPAAFPTRPVRKDEIELSDRGIYIESWLPERRSRRRPLLFVHGELAGSWVWERHLQYFAARGWEGHALNLRNHFWSQTADSDDARPSTATPRTCSRRSSGWATRSWSSATGWAACWPSRPSSAARSAGWSCSSSELPRELRPIRPTPTSCARSRTSTAATCSAGRPCPSGSSATIATSPWPTSCGSSTCSARSRTSRAPPGAR